MDLGELFPLRMSYKWLELAQALLPSGNSWNQHVRLQDGLPKSDRLSLIAKQLSNHVMASSGVLYPQCQIVQYCAFSLSASLGLWVYSRGHRIEQVQKMSKLSRCAKVPIFHSIEKIANLDGHSL